MTRPLDPLKHVPDSTLPDRVKQLGYAPSKTIRIYGREYEIVSDPFMDDGKVAIKVRTTTETRVLRLPATILQKLLKRAS